MANTGYASDDHLSERAQVLLKALVETYIREGHPVGSRVLSRESGLSLSSATVRNVMADLEAHGFVVAPHTSAGRVPTDKGYRFFVNTLLRVQQPAEDEVQGLQRAFENQADNPKALAAVASQVLSSFTRLAGVVLVPRTSGASMSHIEFVGLSENRVLAIIVVNDREVQNRVLRLDRHYSADQLRRAASYLNEHFAGREFSQVRRQLVTQLQETREQMNRMMLDAIALAEQVFEGDEVQDQADVVIAGETNLMKFAEMSNVERLRKLFEAFNEKSDILHLLDQSVSAAGVQIFIGHESGYTTLDDCTVVTAPYARDRDSVGVLGVIGPTRMAYERVIPIVDLTAKLLGAALNSRG